MRNKKVDEACAKIMGWRKGAAVDTLGEYLWDSWWWKDIEGNLQERSVSQWSPSSKLVSAWLLLEWAKGEKGWEAVISIDEGGYTCELFRKSVDEPYTWVSQRYIEADTIERAITEAFLEAHGLTWEEVNEHKAS